MRTDIGVARYQSFQQVEQSALAVVRTPTGQDKRLGLGYAGGDTGNRDAKHLLDQEMLFSLLWVVVGQHAEELSQQTPSR